MDTVTMLPRSRPLTYADLESMPDDGHRYELVDGSLIVTPAPSRLHQFASAELMRRLLASCPPHLAVLAAPVDVRLTDLTVFQPDLLVVERETYFRLDEPVAPLLVVEILSPSTQEFDRSTKFNKFQASGCPSYWLVDAAQPRLTAWNLVDGAYAQVGDVKGDQAWTAQLPFGVTVVPSELVP